MRIEWILTDRRLIVVGGWLTRRAKTVSLDKINEVNYTRRFWERVLWPLERSPLNRQRQEGTTRLVDAADDDPFRDALEAQVEKRRRTIGRH